MGSISPAVCSVKRTVIREPDAVMGHVFRSSGLDRVSPILLPCDSKALEGTSGGAGAVRDQDISDAVTLIRDGSGKGFVPFFFFDRD